MIDRAHVMAVVMLVAGCPKAAPTGEPTSPTNGPTPTTTTTTTTPKVADAHAKPPPDDPGAGERGKLVGLTAAHNEARAKVGVPLLRWSRPLARYAQAWADKLGARGCELEHRRTDKYGENLFWSSNAATASSVVQEWAAESVGYNRRANTCKGTCGHYTQLVWAETRSLGCGMTTCGSAELWVCNYDPPGNVNGRRPF